MKTHMGFKAAQNSIVKREGISRDRAARILASAARHASKAVVKANPRLKNINGVKG